MTEIIEQFRGEYRFLSNFEPFIMEYQGITYPTVEHFYAAQKTHDVALRESLVPLSAGQAKRTAAKFDIRPDWDQVKVKTMSFGLAKKFVTNKKYRMLLTATGDKHILEGNTWGDTFWGYDLNKKEGLNVLGNMLMLIRAFITRNSEAYKRQIDIMGKYLNIQSYHVFLNDLNIEFLKAN